MHHIAINFVDDSLAVINHRDNGATLQRVDHHDHCFDSSSTHIVDIKGVVAEGESITMELTDETGEREVFHSPVIKSVAVRYL